MEDGREGERKENGVRRRKREGASEHARNLNRAPGPFSATAVLDPLASCPTTSLFFSQLPSPVSHPASVLEIALSLCHFLLLYS